MKRKITQQMSVAHNIGFCLTCLIETLKQLMQPINIIVRQPVAPSFKSQNINRMRLFLQKSIITIIEMTIRIIAFLRYVNL